MCDQARGCLAQSQLCHQGDFQKLGLIKWQQAKKHRSRRWKPDIKTVITVCSFPQISKCCISVHQYRMSGIVYIRPSHTSSQLKGVGCVSTPQIHIRPAKIWILTSAPGHTALRWGRASNRGWREQTGRDMEEKGSEPSARRNNGGHFDFRPPSVSSQIQKQRPIMQNKFYRKTEAGGGGGDWKIHVRWGFFSFFFKSHQGTHYNFIISRKTK